MAYFIGGVAVAPESGAFCNVVDSWRYDPAKNSWERLRDIPISGSGGSSGLIVYKERYILLPCGYQYDTLMRPDGRIEPKYGTPSAVERTWKNHPRVATTHYFNHFYVYDTRTNLYGTATALPCDDVATITVVEGDTAYMFPGETAGFVWGRVLRPSSRIRAQGRPERARLGVGADVEVVSVANCALTATPGRARSMHCRRSADEHGPVPRQEFSIGCQTAPQRTALDRGTSHTTIGEWGQSGT